MQIYNFDSPLVKLLSIYYFIGFNRYENFKNTGYYTANTAISPKSKNHGCIVRMSIAKQWLQCKAFMQYQLALLLFRVALSALLYRLPVR